MVRFVHDPISIGEEISLRLPSTPSPEEAPPVSPIPGGELAGSAEERPPFARTSRTAGYEVTLPIKEHLWRRRLGGLVLSGLGGYVMHRGLHSDVLGAPIEHISSPAREVLELGIIGSTLAVTGLREYVTNARIWRATRKQARADKEARNRHASMTKTERAYINIFESGHYERQAPGSVITWRDQFRTMRMGWARDKAAKIMAHINSNQRWLGKDVDTETEEGVRRLNDFGTPAHIYRLRSDPRTPKNFRAHLRAIEENEHHEHKVHTLLHKAHDRYRHRDQHKLDKTPEAVKRLRRLQAKKVSLQRRVDWPSRTYDKTKDKIVRGTRWTAGTAKRNAILLHNGALLALDMRTARANNKPPKLTKEEKRREREERQKRNRAGVV